MQDICVTMIYQDEILVRMGWFYFGFRKNKRGPTLGSPADGDECDDSATQGGAPSSDGASLIDIASTLSSDNIIASMETFVKIL